jgi:hypothetical protein
MASRFLNNENPNGICDKEIGPALQRQAGICKGELLFEELGKRIDE